MRRRTVIDLSQPWAMRVSTPGKDVELDGAPYAFDGALETMQVHQTGKIEDIFQSQYFGTIDHERCIKLPGPTVFFPEIVVTFPALSYVPHIEWAITSDYYGGAVDFPNRFENKVQPAGDVVFALRCGIIASTSSFKLIGTTGRSLSLYEFNSGHPNRQGDFYYTVFKRPTT